ncbi:helix-turn-helix transcriptional regulator [Acetobacterium woodii]|uniref:Putative prophage LambdaCh01 transcriptional regulator n=1 Tax=Acetobacterium woodii (strain ATCC 29683 / DSM 1030 / JCM 2381 / KCTC 1655 / WB1) TaxID=931626 RepID=H6LCD5_ACEWD|nr:helix-turn-helix transcriptional regulator [Acetobacterium woodii]AFA50250.1 putative prophage LambdaCh01 transcriptional regulator [Acetobacterium woodii DSM 1030]
MKETCKSIYRICRDHANLNQDEAAEKLDVHTHTLSNYELGKNVPPDEVILRMAKIYGTPWLPLLHLKENTLIGREIFPNIEVTNLPEAFLKFQAEISDIHPLESEMRKVILDNRIDEHEIETSETFIKEVMEGIMSGWSLIFSAIEKRPLLEQRSQVFTLGR